MGSYAAPTEGYFQFPHTISNTLFLPRTAATGSSAEQRIDLIVPIVPAADIMRATGSMLIGAFTDSAIQISLIDLALTFPTTPPVTYVTLRAAGFPLPTKRVQLQMIWDDPTEMLSWNWRQSGQSLSDNRALWHLGIAPQNFPGSTIYDLAFQLTMSDPSVFGFLGNIYRMMYYENGILVSDISGNNITDPNAASVPGSVGGPYGIQRTSNPVPVLLVPPVSKKVRKRKYR